MTETQMREMLQLAVEESRDFEGMLQDITRSFREEGLLTSDEGFIIRLKAEKSFK